MSQSFPERQTFQPNPDSGDNETTKPDPWGVKRAENLLQSLESVLSARVIVSPVGEITEVHILANSGTGPKQVVRNVESALLAHLGIKVDHPRSVSPRPPKLSLSKRWRPRLCEKKRGDAASYTNRWI